MWDWEGAGYEVWVRAGTGLDPGVVIITFAKQRAKGEERVGDSFNWLLFVLHGRCNRVSGGGEGGDCLVVSLLRQTIATGFSSCL